MMPLTQIPLRQKQKPISLLILYNLPHSTTDAQMFIYQVPHEYLDRCLLILNLPDIACSPSCHQVTPQLESVYLLAALPDWCHLQTYWQSNCYRRSNTDKEQHERMRRVLMRRVGLDVREYLQFTSFFFHARSISF